MKLSKLIFSIAAGILLFSTLSSCVRRDEEMGSRNNPSDPGGVNWSENALPKLSISFDTIWTDADYTDSTGTITIRLEGSDRNFPYDTLRASLRINGSDHRSIFHPGRNERTFTVAALRPDTTFRCTVSVSDRMDEPSSEVINITTGTSLPPPPPEPLPTTGDQSVLLTWQRIDDADHYTIYHDNSRNGTFEDSVIVEQSADDTLISFQDDLAENTQRYYIASSTNEFGRAIAKDTVTGRPYSSRVPSPTIQSISQGSSPICIAISVRISTNYHQFSHIEIYRADNAEGPFELIDTIAANQGITVNYNDTVTSMDTFFYNVTAIDKQGFSSYPSVIENGYLRPLGAPVNFNILAKTDYIALEWSAMVGAAHYRIYRSPSSCTDELALIDTVSTISYIDTPSISSMYYYSISAVDDKGVEGTKSRCLTGRIMLFPYPKDFMLSDTLALRSVRLTWKPVPEAEGYIIYRGTTASLDAIAIINISVIDSVTDTTYIDRPEEAGKYGYLIAAYDHRGIGQKCMSEKVHFTSITGIHAEGFPGQIKVEWLRVTAADSYNIYRSTDGETFTLHDSTTENNYVDTPIDDFIPYYYYVTLRDNNEESFPSPLVSAIRTLDVPDIELTDTGYGIYLNWNSVEGAEKYIIYRSTAPDDTTFYTEVTATGFADTLTGAEGYYYSVAAANDTVTGTPTTAIYGGMPSPVQPPEMSTITPSMYAIRLEWEPQITTSPPDGYYIYRSTSSTSGFIRIDSTPVTVFYDTVPDTVRYYYRLSAYNQLGESQQGNTYIGKLAKPTAPANVRATVATEKDHIHISWTPVGGINEYGVYRTKVASDGYSYIGSSFNTTSYFDSLCTVNVIYYYLVASHIPGNRSAGSSSAAGIRLGPPQLKTATATGDAVTLHWYNVPFSIEYYSVFRAAKREGPYEKIASRWDTVFTDNSPLPEYNFYRISTFNQVESDMSEEVFTVLMDGVTPLPPTRVTASKGTETNRISLSWPSSAGATGYRIYRTPVYSFSRDTTLVAEIAETTCFDVVESDSIYYYKVTSFNNNGESGFINSVEKGYRYPSRKPYAPTDLHRIEADSGITIGWHRPSTAVGFNYYNIYRAEAEDGPFELIASTMSLDYIDIPPETTPKVYWYRTTAENQRGESTPSDPVSGTRPQ